MTVASSERYDDKCSAHTVPRSKRSCVNANSHRLRILLAKNHVGSAIAIPTRDRVEKHFCINLPRLETLPNWINFTSLCASISQSFLVVHYDSCCVVRAMRILLLPLDSEFVLLVGKLLSSSLSIILSRALCLRSSSIYPMHIA